MKLNEKPPQPLKIQYRSELIAKLKENKIKEAENVNVVSPGEMYVIICIIFHITIPKFTSKIFSQEFLVKQTESFLQKFEDLISKYLFVRYHEKCFTLNYKFLDYEFFLNIYLLTQ